MEHEFGKKSMEELEKESSLSSWASTSTSGQHMENAADLTFNEPSPSKDWKLPPIKPQEVYDKIPMFHMIAKTSIKIRERALTTKANLNTMMKVPLLNIEDIEQAKKQKYKYMHLGAVKIGINPLHRSGQNTYVFSALLDQRWTKFTEALLGGVQAPLNAGPVSFTAFPNFACSLSDPHVLDVLTLGIQTAGYETFKSAAHNLAIFFSICVRFTNTLVPAVIHADRNTVTMLNYDEGMQPMVPHQIPRAQLKPPASWITSWESPSASASSTLEQSVIKEVDGQVVVSFPNQSHTNQSSLAQRGEFTTIPTSSSFTNPIPSYQLHPDFNSLLKDFNTLQETNRQLQRSLTSTQTQRLMAPNSFSPSIEKPQSTNSPLEKNCDHPDCQSTCQKKPRRPFGHDTALDHYVGMHEPEYVDSEFKRKLNTLIQRKREEGPRRARPGLGYDEEPIPAHRLQKTKINPTESEIRRFLVLHKGSSPYNPNDIFMKKMMNWDLVTHEKSSEFMEMVEEQKEPQRFMQQAKESWMSYMKKYNMWLSFYHYFYSHSKQEQSLVLYKKDLI